MAYAKACSQKFVLYLYNNNHLQNFTIEKNAARQLYYENFKATNKAKLGFGTVFFHIVCLKLLKKQKDHDLMVFNQNKLLKLTSNEGQFDLTIEKGVAAKKKTLVVSHSFSFNSNKASEESVLSEKECKLCDVHFPNVENYQQHVTKSTHAFFEEINKSLKQPKKQADLQFAIEGAQALNNIILRKEVPKTVNLVVKNMTKYPMQIVTVVIKPVSEIELFKPSYPHDLAPLSSIQYPITVCRKSGGILYFPILFKAKVNNNAQNYSAELVFHTHDDLLDELHPVQPYVRTSKAVLKEYIEEIDSGERPNIFPQRPNKIPLLPYRLPIDVQIVLNAGLKPFNGMSESQKLQMDHIKSLLDTNKKPYTLNASNYTKLLDMLLYIEEHQMYKDIRDYDMENQVLKASGGGLLELEVPGLAEHRPSVIFADPVFIREQKNSRTLYQGFVHQVKVSSVLLKFSKRFMNEVFVKNKKFYVNFTFNRYPLKVEHQAVAFAKSDNIASLLFPQKISATPIKESAISWFNRDIANNPEQQRAVQSILQRTAMPAPYLIFGPPGTGKTMTVVEGVRQIYKLTNHKVLICTPSNSAANEVTKRLITIPTTDLLRYIAPSFPFDQIPGEIKKHINYPHGNYYYPSIEEFMKYRIVITTVVSAAKLVNSGCLKDHFGYVFIDESGQATETETLIPIAGILSNGKKQGTLSGQIVLAGDPKQLGPVIHSTLAKEFGFGISMLERLMDTSKPYKKESGTNKYNDNALTKLLKNYRSHSAIMQPSNELFYENELQTAGDHLINAAINWEHLPNPKIPLIFHSVVGVDMREKTSPSFFNIQEIEIVLHYLDLLIGCKMQGMKIKEEHIGIISPYKKQVDKIKQACTKKKYSNQLMIGSVEQVQGQERLIIIISTVRSKADFLKFDNKFHLGFLDNPKRFNVAITRAKALLIVVGNPNILQYDKSWRHFIAYCKIQKAMVGEKFEFSDVEKKKEEVVQESALIATVEAALEDGPGFSRGVV